MGFKLKGLFRPVTKEMLAPDQGRQVGSTNSKMGGFNLEGKYQNLIYQSKVP